MSYIITFLVPNDTQASQSTSGHVPAAISKNFLCFKWDRLMQYWYFLITEWLTQASPVVVTEWSQQVGPQVPLRHDPLGLFSLFLMIVL